LEKALYKNISIQRPHVAPPSILGQLFLAGKHATGTWNYFTVFSKARHNLIFQAFNRYMNSWIAAGLEVKVTFLKARLQNLILLQTWKTRCASRSQRY